MGWFVYHEGGFSLTCIDCEGLAAAMKDGANLLLLE